MYTRYTRKHMYTRGAWPTTTKRLTWEEHEAKEANGKRAARNGDGVAGSPQHVQHSLVHVRPSLELLAKPRQQEQRIICTGVDGCVSVYFCL